MDVGVLRESWNQSPEAAKRGLHLWIPRLPSQFRLHKISELIAPWDTPPFIGSWPFSETIQRCQPLFLPIPSGSSGPFTKPISHLLSTFVHQYHTGSEGHDQAWSLFAFELGPALEKRTPWCHVSARLWWMNRSLQRNKGRKGVERRKQWATAP